MAKRIQHHEKQSPEHYTEGPFILVDCYGKWRIEMENLGGQYSKVPKGKYREWVCRVTGTEHMSSKDEEFLASCVDQLNKRVTQEEALDDLTKLTESMGLYYELRPITDLKNWRWVGGMSTIHGDRVTSEAYQIEDGTWVPAYVNDHHELGGHELPDLEDHATLSCIEYLVSEVLGERVYMIPQMTDRLRWAVGTLDANRIRIHTRMHKTRGDALYQALMEVDTWKTE